MTCVPHMQQDKSECRAEPCPSKGINADVFASVLVDALTVQDVTFVCLCELVEGRGGLCRMKPKIYVMGWIPMVAGCRNA